MLVYQRVILRLVEFGIATAQWISVQSQKLFDSPVQFTEKSTSAILGTRWSMEQWWNAQTVVMMMMLLLLLLLLLLRMYATELRLSSTPCSDCPEFWWVHKVLNSFKNSTLIMKKQLFSLGLPLWLLLLHGVIFLWSSRLSRQQHVLERSAEFDYIKNR